MQLDKSLKEIIVEQGFISNDQLAELLANRSDATENVGEMLVRIGVLSEKQHLQCQALASGIPFVDLQHVDLDIPSAKRISHQLAVKNRAIPIEITDYAASVAFANPLNIDSIDEVREQLGLDVDPMWATDGDIREAIFRTFGSFDNLSVLLGEFHKEVEVETLDGQTAEEAVQALSITDAEDGAPVIRLCNALLSRAIRTKASDIHVEPGSKETRVRFRVDGILSEVMTIPKVVQRPVVSRYKVIAGLDIGERRIPQDGRFSVTHSGSSYDFRVSTYPTVHGEKVVMRVLDKGSVNVNLRHLGIPQLDLERITSKAEESQGLIIVTGPTGSGKSTTLYSILSHLNDATRNIVTIEDPVEYQLDGITQANVNNGAGMTFANGLRAILRQDPDVVLVGESRDPETAKTAIEASLTGHMVLTSLHANDSAAAVTRLLEMGVEPFLVSAAATLSVAQRLMRVNCPSCKAPYQPEISILEALHLPTGKEYMRGVGCEKCSGTGYKGRIGVYEVLEINSKIRAMIFASESTDMIRREGMRIGMRTLRQDANTKVLEGLTTPEEVLRVTPSEDGS